MTQRRFILIAIIVCALSPLLSSAPQARYDYYLTGNGTNADGETTLGIGLMGGGTDVDALFTWMSERAGGGDFVVIRASGADGYNQYVFDLGDFDSVETLVLQNRNASFDPFVLETIENAEALFIAGGDQSNYVNFWKGTPVEEAIHDLALKGDSDRRHQRGDGDPERVRLRRPAPVSDLGQGVGGSVSPRHYTRERLYASAAHERADYRPAPDRARPARTNARLHGAYRPVRMAGGEPQHRDRSRNGRAGRRLGGRHDRGQRRIIRRRTPTSSAAARRKSASRRLR